MKEYIDREALLVLIEEAWENARIQSSTFAKRSGKTLWYGTFSGINYCRNRLLEAPAADVVEVVRCKDCKHAIIVDDDFPEDEVACSLLSQDVACNNYCMYGEKGEQRHIGKEEDPYEVREKMDKEE